MRAQRAALIVMALGVGMVADVGTASAADGSQSSRVLELKFRDGTDVRLRGDQFRDSARLELLSVLDRYRGIEIEPLFHRSAGTLRRERQRAQRRSGRHLPDLALWYRVTIAPGQPIDRLVARLRRERAVKSVRRAQLAAPPPVTPSFVGQQGYLQPAPTGIDRAAAASVAGGLGDQVRVVDIEYSWNRAHEDLTKAASPDALIANGTPRDPFSDSNHGAGVLGELVGDDNAFGVTGVVSRTNLGLVNAYNDERGWDLANAINTAQSATVSGDVILIEQQAYGPRNEFVPVEWIPSVYDAIRMATAAGRAVVEPAGNGGANLDDPIYGKRFPQGKPDSGALIVGAGAAPCNGGQPARARLSFSGYGRRVNLQGWGQCVTTAGYGDLYATDATSKTDWYTAAFSGTSSASPMVASAAASFASAYEQANGVAPTPSRIRQVLVASGTAQADPAGGNIGPLPNLSGALSRRYLR